MKVSYGEQNRAAPASDTWHPGRPHYREDAQREPEQEQSRGGDTSAKSREEKLSPAGWLCPGGTLEKPEPR